MNANTEEQELDAAIAEAELTDEEAGVVRELVKEGGNPVAVIAFVLRDRDPADEEEEPEAPPAAPEPAFVVDDTKVEKEIERHLNRMAELLGPAAEQYSPCEACGAAGILIPGPQMKPNERYRACPTCDGYGQVLTGSKDPSHVHVNCPTCMGRGYQEKIDQPPPAGVTPIVPQPPADEFGTPAWMGDPSVQPRTASGGWQ